MILDMNLLNVFMEEVTKNSNDYVEKRRVLEQNIQIWDQKHMSVPFYFKTFYHLLALVFYMGVVCLTFKTTYWKYAIIWPCHPIMYEMGMIQYRFVFMWRQFHISSVDLSDAEN